MDEQNQLKLFGQGGLVFDTNQPVLSSLALLPGIGLGAKAFPYALKGAKAIPGLFKSAGPKPMVGKYGSTRYLNQPAGPLNFTINNPVVKNPYLSLGIPAAGARFFSESSPQNVLDTLPDQINLQPLNYSGDFSVVDSKLPEPFMQSNIPSSPNLLDEQFNLVNKPEPEVIAPEVITPEVEKADETIAQEVESVVEKIDPEKLSNKNRQIANMLFALSDVLRGKDPVPGALQRKQMFEAQEEKRQAKAAQERVGQLIDGLNLSETNKELLKLMPLQTQANVLFSSDKEKSANELINQQELMVLQKLQQLDGDVDRLNEYEKIIYDNYIKKTDGADSILDILKSFNPDGNEKLEYEIEPVSQ